MADDEDSSDLTSIESEDDPAPAPSTSTSTRKTTSKATAGAKRKGGGGKSGGYRIKNALKVPRATTYTAQALFDQIHSNDINLEPEYQRDVVWTEAKQIGLIDSIFRNFYIPPIIFSVNSYEDGSETKTCIDGKQRLTSIHKFMDGLIPRKSPSPALTQQPTNQITPLPSSSPDKDPETGEKLYYKDTLGSSESRSSRRQLLPVKYQRLFANKQIVCVEYQDISDASEREVFQRVQLGVALTPAEKLQVIKTPRADFIREILNTYMREDASSLSHSPSFTPPSAAGWLSSSREGGLDWDTSRGSDFRGLAQAVYCMDSLSTPQSTAANGNYHKHVGIAPLEKWLSQDKPFDGGKAFEGKVREAYRIFAEMVRDKKVSKSFRKAGKVSPVEFISIGVLIFQHMGAGTRMEELGEGVERLREDVREKHVDVRNNNRVVKTMMDFILTWKPGSGSGGEGATSTATAGGTKRKRGKKVDDDDDDENAMDVDDGDGDGVDGDGDGGDYTENVKAKKAPKKSAGATAGRSTSTSTPRVRTTAELSSSSAVAAAQSQSQLNPNPNPNPTPPTPTSTSTSTPIDRMAAFRAAKAQASAQRAASSSSTTPALSQPRPSMGLPTRPNFTASALPPPPPPPASAPAALPPGGFNTSAHMEHAHAPQMLPSPGQPFTFPSSLAGALGGQPSASAGAGAAPPPPSQMSLDSTLMATMMRLPSQSQAQAQAQRLPSFHAQPQPQPQPQLHAPAPTALPSPAQVHSFAQAQLQQQQSSFQQPQGLPPPPSSAGSFSSESGAYRERDREWDREWDRDRDRDRYGDRERDRRDRDREWDRDRERERERERDRERYPPPPLPGSHRRDSGSYRGRGGTR